MKACVGGNNMQRSLWRGAISFGLIYVPVDIFSASKDNNLPLHMLDSRDFAPVGYHRVNKVTGKEVDWGHIVKGYEYKKGEYVALSDADFKHANVRASETIAIDTFCDVDDIPPKYYETPYCLTPGKGGQKVYALLRQALQSTKKVAVATFVMRGREHLCVVAPSDKSLMLLTLRFADEMLPEPQWKAADHGKINVSAAELAMAKQLVEGMSRAFKPERFKDTYRADLKRRVQEKIRKKQTHSLDSEPAKVSDRPKAQVIDLMDALRASLKHRGKAPLRANPKKSLRSRVRA
jgi:DNA end-binding protein Ku